jgi:transposase
MGGLRLGIDVACREAHRAALADAAGAIVWGNRRFTTSSAELEALWAAVRAVDPDAEVTVVMEPTRNAWAPLAAWLRARGATVRMVAPEQSADLRKYYNKHAKTDRLDAALLARLPALHPEGLDKTPGLGPAEALRRTAGRRARLVADRRVAVQRLDALVELLGPAWHAVLGSDPGKTALELLARYSDPRAAIRAGRARLAKVVIKTSRGAWREDKADALLAAARETLALWPAGGIDFGELATDITAEITQIRALDEQITAIETRLTRHYQHADPEALVISAPGIAEVGAAVILGRLGDPSRFATLAAVRAYTGLVPKVSQSGATDRHDGPTKAGDHVLRAALFVAADHARRVDPTLATRYAALRAKDKHHNSAICTLAAVLITRIAACWRSGQRYQLRDLEGRPITDTEARAISKKILDAAATTRSTTAGTGRRSKESQRAPSTGPSTTNPRTSPTAA